MTYIILFRLLDSAPILQSIIFLLFIESLYLVDEKPSIPRGPMRNIIFFMKGCIRYICSGSFFVMSTTRVTDNSLENNPWIILPPFYRGETGRSREAKEVVSSSQWKNDDEAMTMTMITMIMTRITFISIINILIIAMIMIRTVELLL